VARANIFSPDFDGSSDREGYRWRCARVGAAVGGAQIGGAVYELPEGEKTWPYHIHHGTEEWLVVLSGSPTLRGPDGERTLQRGDVVCFPTGPDGAHQVTGPGSVLILSSSCSPESLEYPDSGKVGVRPPRMMFRAADDVDYWEGE
jgi:uncharacterized cupin superfamily protein